MTSCQAASALEVTVRDRGRRARARGDVPNAYLAFRQSCWRWRRASRPSARSPRTRPAPWARRRFPNRDLTPWAPDQARPRAWVRGDGLQQVERVRGILLPHGAGRAVSASSSASPGVRPLRAKRARNLAESEKSDTRLIIFCWARFFPKQALRFRVSSLQKKEPKTTKYRA